jgi:hypothetical protein
MALCLAASIGITGCGTLQPSESNKAEINAETITVNGDRASAHTALLTWAAQVNAEPEVVERIMANLPAGDFSLITQAINHEVGGNSSNSPSAAYTNPVSVPILSGDKALEAVADVAKLYSNPVAASIANTAAGITNDPQTQQALVQLANGVQACADCAIPATQ